MTKRAPNLSATALGRYMECPRKWWYHYVGGFRSPSKQSTETGKAIHAINEAYFETGGWPAATNQLDPVALTLPGKDAVEALRTPDGLWESEMPLRVRAGRYLGPLRFRGYVDYVHTGDRRIIDFKSTGRIDADYHPTPDGLTFDTQMVLYAGVVFYDNPGPVHVGHYRYSSKFPAFRKVMASRPTPWSVVEDLLGTANEIAKSMFNYLSVDDPGEIPYKLEACGAYGGCMHLAYCPAQKSLLNLAFGEPTMSVLDMINGTASTGAATPPAINPPDSPGPAQNSDNINAAKIVLAAKSFANKAAATVWLVSDDGRKFLADFGLASANIPALLEVLDSAAPPPETSTPEESPVNATPEGGAVSHESILNLIRSKGEDGKLSMTDKDLVGLIKSATGAERLTAKKKFAYLGEIEGIDYDTNHVWLDAESETPAAEPEAAPSAQAEPAPSPAPQTTTAPTKTESQQRLELLSTGMTVFVGCRPDGECVHMDKVLAEAMARVNIAEGVQSYLEIDFKGPAKVYGQFIVNPGEVPPRIYAEKFHPLRAFFRQMFPSAEFVWVM